jgi:hypothetical protein
MNGGDMWWDSPTGSAAYEVPKGSNKNALFAGSIWIGGKDASLVRLKWRHKHIDKVVMITGVVR